MIKTDASNNWIRERIAEARLGHDLITEKVVLKIETLIKGNLSAKQLSPTELNRIANGLLILMTPPTVDSQDCDED